jgi:N-acetylmuramic acid 6-phosphate etherase
MLERLTTEARNPASERLDSLSALEIVNLMNAEDATIAAAVGREETAIATAIDQIVERLRSGGRLLYMGSGTSGRLGVLDAAECPPTFNTNPAQVVGIIAGGYDALVRSIEGAEDVPDLATTDLIENNLSGQDVLVGIATSGRTPYVVKGLEYARKVGAYAIGLSCNDASDLVAAADLMITPVVGPEIISGSTRMKAGTATKMVLNMLTTGTMVRLGKTYGNLMVDLRATNNKLADRSRRIVKSVTGLSNEESQQLLDRCDGEVKTAIVVQESGCSVVEARSRLERNAGHLRRALEEQV